MPYKSTTDLAGRVRSYICRCVKIPHQFWPIVTAFVMATWLADRLHILPHLCIVGPPQSGKTTLLQTLSMVCRHALVVSDLWGMGPCLPNPASQFTMMFDNVDWDSPSYRGHFQRFLVADAPRATILLGSDRAQSPYGPKLICATVPPEDEAVKSRCIQIPMVAENNTGLWKPTDREVEKEVRDLQQMLLQMRLQCYSSIKPVQVPHTGQLSPREQDMLSCLAAVFASNPDWVDSISRSYEYVPRQQTASPQLAAVVKAVFVVGHDPEFQGNMKVGLVASLAQQYLEMEGERVKLNPRRVGDILTALGFTSSQRQKIGWTRIFTRSDIEKAHELMRSYSILVPPLSTARECKMCDAMRAREEMSVVDDDDEPGGTRAAAGHVKNDSEHATGGVNLVNVMNICVGSA